EVLQGAPGDPDGPNGPNGPHVVAGGSLEYFSATRIEVRFARAQAREVDGDSMSEGALLTAGIEPGALRMRLPRAPGATALPHAPGHSSQTPHTAHH
ncbi:diacylglycerol kinase, partial [Streptomyces sp. CJ_13]|nr:diacylglycerol kinase [Streptomyces sp. CJ_13]